MSDIKIRDARVKNLKGISCDFPEGAFSVVTGPSGSGKSSLVFDLLGAEAERLGALISGANSTDSEPLPGVVAGLPFAIQIKPTARRAQKETVATRLGVYDALLEHAALVAAPYCVACGVPLVVYDDDHAHSRVGSLPEKTRVVVWVPLSEVTSDDRLRLLQAGLLRARVDAELVRLEDATELGSCSVLIDSFAFQPQNRIRFREALELGRITVRSFPKSLGVIEVEAGEQRFQVSSEYRCSECGVAQRKLEPALFDYRIPAGRCLGCRGAGWVYAVPVDLDEEKFRYWFVRHVPPSRRGLWPEGSVLQIIPAETVDFESASSEHNSVGTLLSTLFRESKSAKLRRSIERLLLGAECSVCNGTGIGAEGRLAKVGSIEFGEIFRMPIETLLRSCAQNEASLPRRAIEVFGALQSLGLDYLSLHRRASTLSAGETERLFLARGVRSRLSGVAYLVDEPSAGLHPRDIRGVMNMLRQLRAAGNTIIATDHHPRVIEAADYQVELGPGGGRLGGSVVYQGVPRGCDVIDTLSERMHAHPMFELPPSSVRNLKNVALRFPQRTVTAFAGVSGSGKSTAVFEVIEPYVRGKILPPWMRRRGARVELSEESPFRAVFSYSTSRVRRIRSALWSVVGLAEEFQALLAQSPVAQMRGLTKKDFSLHSATARCGTCNGEGKLQRGLECPGCGGSGIGSAILEVTFRGYSLAQLSRLSIDEAATLFARLHEVKRKCDQLCRFGLGYLRLGEMFSSLSYGEQQRVLLVRMLSQVRSPEGVLLLLDEPVRGLSQSEIAPIIAEFRALTEQGATVVCIEHNPVFLNAADYLVEMGPGAGKLGGRVVFEGTPAALRRSTESPLLALP